MDAGQASAAGLVLVQNWRRFVNAPQRYLRHLFDPAPDPE